MDLNRPVDAAPAIQSDLWYVLLIDDNKVGYRHVVEKKLQQAGTELLETIAKEHIEILREGQRIVTDIEIISREKTNGELIGIEYQLPFRENGIRIQGRIVGGALRLETTSGEAPPIELPWSENAVGPFGIESSLRKSPLQPHQTRTLRMFFPAMSQVMDITLQALEWEKTQLLDGENQLLRIDMRWHLPDHAKIVSNAWMDRNGEIWKETQSFGVTVTSYRTTRQAALALGTSQTLDLFQRTLIPLDPPQKNLHARQEIEYEYCTAKGNPAALFCSGHRQGIRTIASNAARLVVRADPPTESASGTEDPSPGGLETECDQPTAADKTSSAYARSDHPRIRQLAESVLPDVDDPQRVAVALDQLVYGLIERKSYSQVFAPANEVLDRREGDCTEHSVLLVALCRARNIPARAAMGMVYSDVHGAFAYHMWCEVWTGSQWIGLDATRSDGRVGPAHLKMATSHLDGPTPLTEMLAILQAVDGLKIKVVRVQ